MTTGLEYRQSAYPTLVLTLLSVGLAYMGIKFFVFSSRFSFTLTLLFGILFFWAWLVIIRQITFDGQFLKIRYALWYTRTIPATEIDSISYHTRVIDMYWASPYWTPRWMRPKQGATKGVTIVFMLKNKPASFSRGITGPQALSFAQQLASCYSGGD